MHHSTCISYSVFDTYTYIVFDWGLLRALRNCVLYRSSYWACKTFAGCINIYILDADICIDTTPLLKQRLINNTIEKAQLKNSPRIPLVTTPHNPADSGMHCLLDHQYECVQLSTSHLTQRVQLSTSVGTSPVVSTVQHFNMLLNISNHIYVYMDFESRLFKNNVNMKVVTIILSPIEVLIVTHCF